MNRKSWRPTQFAERHSVSPSFIYGEIKAKRLRARKAGAATIITEDDEADWLDAMPTIGAPKQAEPDTQRPSGEKL
jgi:hypothetical protein